MHQKNVNIWYVIITDSLYNSFNKNLSTKTALYSRYHNISMGQYPGNWT